MTKTKVEKKKQTTGPAQRHWIKWLRSGKLKQVTGVLTEIHTSYDIETDGLVSTEVIGHCCLGVASECAIHRGLKVNVKDNVNERIYNGQSQTLPQKVQQAFAFRNDDGQFTVKDARKLLSKKRFLELCNRVDFDENDDYDLTSLAVLNDNGKSFSFIADLVSDFPELFFKKPV